MNIHNLVVAAVAVTSVLFGSTAPASAAPHEDKPISCTPQTDYDPYHLGGTSAPVQSDRHKLVQKTVSLGLEVERYDNCEAAVFAPQTATPKRTKLGFIYCEDGWAWSRMVRPNDLTGITAEMVFSAHELISDLEAGDDCMNGTIVALSEFE
jgi:hypothetical protein